MEARVIRFPQRHLSSEEYRAAAQRILDMPFEERLARKSELGLDHPETLLSLTEKLRGRLAAAPSEVRDEAGFFYRFLEKPKRPIGLFDERDYFLGECALIAGTACRQLSRWEEARLWFDRAESRFRHTASAEGDLSRLGYQRLALRLEERQLDAVLELAPSLAETLTRLGMPEEALKCRFLEGLALLESNHLTESVEVFKGICEEARTLKSKKLLAEAYVNLTHAYAIIGDSAEAIEASQNAIPVLKRLDDRVALAKVQWGLATMLRETGQINASIEVYRTAQKEFESIGMRADTAALSLVVADLLLECGREKEALREVLAALPVIDELKMVPEGVAALSLLRKSLRQQKIDRQALRNLHGYFEDLKS